MNRIIQKEMCSNTIKRRGEVNITSTIQIPISELIEILHNTNPQPPSKEILNRIKTIAEKNGIILESDQLEKAAMVLGKWSSSSPWEQKEGIIPEVLGAIATNKPFLLYLYISKAGQLASYENRPDLGELIFLARIGKLTPRLYLADEASILPFDSSLAYKEELLEMGKLLGIEIKIIDIKFDQEKANELNKFESLENDQFNKRVAKMLKAVSRSIGKVTLDTIKETIKFVAIMDSRFQVNECLHVSVTTHEGRLNIGWPFALLPIHGVPLIYRDKNGKMRMQELPEREIDAAFDTLKNNRTLEFYKIEDENGKFLAYGIGRNINTKDIYEAVKNSMLARAKDDKNLDSIVEIIAKMGIPTDQIEKLKGKLTSLKEEEIRKLERMLDDMLVEQQENKELLKKLIEEVEKDMERDRWKSLSRLI